MKPRSILQNALLGTMSMQYVVDLKVMLKIHKSRVENQLNAHQIKDGQKT